MFWTFERSLLKLESSLYTFYTYYAEKNGYQIVDNFQIIQSIVKYRDTVTSECQLVSKR